MSCPVVQLCKGSCMFLEGEFFKQSCANEFAVTWGYSDGGGVAFDRDGCSWGEGKIRRETAQVTLAG